MVRVLCGGGCFRAVQLMHGSLIRVDQYFKWLILCTGRHAQLKTDESISKLSFV